VPRYAPKLSNYCGSPVDLAGALTLQLTLAPMQEAVAETLEYRNKLCVGRYETIKVKGKMWTL
jgi:hypothetical protein